MTTSDLQTALATRLQEFGARLQDTILTSEEVYRANVDDFHQELCTFVGSAMTRDPGAIQGLKLGFLDEVIFEFMGPKCPPYSAVSEIYRKHNISIPNPKDPPQPAIDVKAGISPLLPNSVPVSSPDSASQTPSNAAPNNPIIPSISSASPTSASPADSKDSLRLAPPSAKIQDQVASLPEGTPVSKTEDPAPLPVTSPSPATGLKIRILKPSGQSRVAVGRVSSSADKDRDIELDADGDPDDESEVVSKTATSMNGSSEGTSTWKGKGKSVADLKLNGGGTKRKRRKTSSEVVVDDDGDQDKDDDDDDYEYDEQAETIKHKKARKSIAAPVPTAPAFVSKPKPKRCRKVETAPDDFVAPKEQSYRFDTGEAALQKLRASDEKYSMANIEPHYAQCYWCVLASERCYYLRTKMSCTTCMRCRGLKGKQCSHTRDSKARKARQRVNGLPPAQSVPIPAPTAQQPPAHPSYTFSPPTGQTHLMLGPSHPVSEDQSCKRTDANPPSILYSGGFYTAMSDLLSRVKTLEVTQTRLQDEQLTINGRFDELAESNKTYHNFFNQQIESVKKHQIKSDMTLERLLGGVSRVEGGLGCLMQEIKDLKAGRLESGGFCHQMSSSGGMGNSGGQMGGMVATSSRGGGLDSMDLAPSSYDLEDIMHQSAFQQSDDPSTNGQRMLSPNGNMFSYGQVQGPLNGGFNFSPAQDIPHPYPPVPPRREIGHPPLGLVSQGTENTTITPLNQLASVAAQAQSSESRHMSSSPDTADINVPSIALQTPP